MGVYKPIISRGIVNRLVEGFVLFTSLTQIKSVREPTISGGTVNKTFSFSFLLFISRGLFYCL